MSQAFISHSFRGQALIDSMSSVGGRLARGLALARTNKVSVAEALQENSTPVHVLLSETRRTKRQTKLLFAPGLRHKNHSESRDRKSEGQLAAVLRCEL
jgi:hypothetical protein